MNAAARENIASKNNPASFCSFANMMPYMVSYMRQHSEGEAGRDLTYADFIVVQSAWGITQVRKCEKNIRRFFEFRLFRRA